MTTNASTLSPHMQTQLEALRDIALPAPITWWPLAPGWWISMVTACVMLAVATFFLYWRRRSITYFALHELDTLRSQLPQVSKLDLATDVSVLLRRVAIVVTGKNSGTLNDADWIEYLTQGKYGMDIRTAELLAQAPYVAELDEAAPESSRLLDVAELWIRRHA